ncbi:shikimate kinase [Flavobacterium sp.]|uniref:shikimate kinase n=1 Tax=Flavobacterium sp. TaxID=239 RepID=UPI0028BF4CD7|nr:shikimate kinase [Flavobacterium sp.]
MRKIILVGYMGSGKTTIGKLLSEKLQLPFFDLDDLIENETQNTISQIFAEQGEIKFRKIEHTVLNQFIDSNDEFVLSLGGGTPCYANNHLLLQRDDVFSVYLKTSISELVSRLQKEKKHRPIIANLSDSEIDEFIAKHLFDRSYFYNQSKTIVSVDGKLPLEIVNEIVEKLA